MRTVINIFCRLYLLSASAVLLIEKCIGHHLKREKKLEEKELLKHNIWANREVQCDCIHIYRPTICGDIYRSMYTYMKTVDVLYLYYTRILFLYTSFNDLFLFHRVNIDTYYRQIVLPKTSISNPTWHLPSSCDWKSIPHLRKAANKAWDTAADLNATDATWCHRTSHPIGLLYSISLYSVISAKRLTYLWPELSSPRLIGRLCEFVSLCNMYDVTRLTTE